ncbi:hypothetical protein EBB59_11015 [Lysobacter pythonis]|uniref:Uncharacterized protein n=1 Tax=Solilutibacter pythonis TaxID=2483112 RepID=A0A3M2HGZ5_9GAMM|nr:hypothetical protein [Lysobacter pythonis]RMH88996.1 hypothetical protein EBB59_11015 [Lysobacter pythonis]
MLAESRPPAQGNQARASAWPAGRYRVIGYDATRKASRHRSLAASGNEDDEALRLRRTADGKPRHGHARTAPYGADRVSRIEVRFDDDAIPRRRSYVAYADDDNLHRLTRARPPNGPNRDVEAWFGGIDD